MNTNLYELAKETGDNLTIAQIADVELHGIVRKRALTACLNRSMREGDVAKVEEILKILDRPITPDEANRLVSIVIKNRNSNDMLKRIGCLIQNHKKTSVFVRVMQRIIRHYGIDEIHLSVFIGLLPIKDRHQGVVKMLVILARKGWLREKGAKALNLLSADKRTAAKKEAYARLLDEGDLGPAQAFAEFFTWGKPSKEDYERILAAQIKRKDIHEFTVGMVRENLGRTLTQKELDPIFENLVTEDPGIRSYVKFIAYNVPPELKNYYVHLTVVQVLVRYGNDISTVRNVTKLSPDRKEKAATDTELKEALEIVMSRGFYLSKRTVICRRLGIETTSDDVKVMIKGACEHNPDYVPDLLAAYALFKKDELRKKKK